MKIGLVIAICWIVGMFLGLMLPLIIICSKGFTRSTWKKETKVEITFKKVMRWIFTVAFLIFVLPAVLIFLHNFVAIVVVDKFPASTVTNNIMEYSYRPLFEFYDNVLWHIETFIYAVIS
ncbi:MAG: hypothetical protein K8S27_07005 [Candidatus Omnitrophica bacterium]|nr:hypothetical protein [Candidatus Omnitrophota bacterium]